MKTILSSLTLGIGITFLIPSVPPAFAAGVVGSGTPASCTDAALTTALTGGGTVTFNCGGSPQTIVVSQKVIAANTTIDGGNLITLSGGGANRIFSVNNSRTFIVKNLTIANGNSTAQGGGIFAGNNVQLIVSNSKFNNNISTSSATIFDGGGAIYISSGSQTIVQNSTFTGNQANNGGAINNLLSNLTVTNSTFSNNSSLQTGSGGGGGAIYIDGAKGGNGTITFKQNTFNQNTAVFQGGGIFIQLYNSDKMTIDQSIISSNSVTGGGAQGFGGGFFLVGNPNTILNITNTTFSSNTASNQGGGFWTGTNGVINLTNSTLSGNRAESATNSVGNGGGIMRTNGKLVITNATIANNYASFQGGGIFGDPNVTIKNTIVANNIANNSGMGFNIKNNCFSLMTDGGNNLEFPNKNAADPSDNNCVTGIQIVNPQLGALGNNGGTTPTMPLLPGSPAVNGGNNATCPTIDQRGVTRPQGGTCDIGAFELN
jgi:hypothetical protein